MGTYTVTMTATLSIELDGDSKKGACAEAEELLSEVLRDSGAYSVSYQLFNVKALEVEE